MRDMGPGPELIGRGKELASQIPISFYICSGTVTSWEVVSGGFSKPQSSQGFREVNQKQSPNVVWKYCKGQMGGEAWLDHSPQSFIH